MIYTVFENPNALPHEKLALDNVQAIPESVSVWAIIAPPFWLLRHRLWMPLALYVIVALFLLGLLNTPFWLVTALLSGLPGLYLWLEGNQLRRSDLQRRGYELTKIVDAPDEDMALAKFYSGITTETV